MLTGVVVVISRDRSIDGAIRIFTRGDRAPALPFYADGVGLLLVIAGLIARSEIVTVSTHCSAPT